MSSSLSYAYFMKPAVGGAAAYLIENILLKQSSKQSAISAVSVAIALSTTPLLTPYLPKDEKTSGMVARALEIGVSTANATALNKFVFKNDVSGTITKKLATVILANIVAEYVSDFVNERPLALFA